MSCSPRLQMMIRKLPGAAAKSKLRLIALWVVHGGAHTKERKSSKTHKKRYGKPTHEKKKKKKGPAGGNLRKKVKKKKTKRIFYYYYYERIYVYKQQASTTREQRKKKKTSRKSCRISYFCLFNKERLYKRYVYIYISVWVYVSYLRAHQKKKKKCQQITNATFFFFRAAARRHGRRDSRDEAALVKRPLERSSTRLLLPLNPRLTRFRAASPAFVHSRWVAHRGS